MLPYAKSLDTFAFFTHTPADMVALWEAMGHSSERDETLTFGVPDPMPDVDAEMATEVQNAIDTRRRAGIVTRPIDIAGLLRTVDAATNDLAMKRSTLPLFPSVEFRRSVAVRTAAQG